mgnify:FL=1
MKNFQRDYRQCGERMCAVHKGDMFKGLREGKASVVTDHIKNVTKTGIKLESGDWIPADIIVTATGLDLQMLGGAELRVDGTHVNLSNTMMYKGLMLEKVPNMALVFGYTNASWTLKADIASEFVCRLLKHMRKTGAEKVTPIDEEGCGSDVNFLNLRSGYIQRADDRLPRQGNKDPWQNLNDYLHDLPALRYGKMNDGHLKFETTNLHKTKRNLVQKLLSNTSI